MNADPKERNWRLAEQIFWLNVLDYVLTVYGIHVGALYEANPLFGDEFITGPLGALFKLVLVPLVLVVLAKLGKPNSGVLRALRWIYGAVVVWNSALLGVWAIWIR